MVFNISLFDRHRFGRKLSISGTYEAYNSQLSVDVSDIWNSDGFLSLVFASPKHRACFYGFEITI